LADESFPLPKSSYDQLTRIIKGYGQQTTDATPADVGQLTGVNPSDVSRNTGFLVAIDALTRGQKKSLTEPGRSLARALEHEMPEEIRTHWRNLVLSSEFFQKILAAVRIRKGMEVNALRAHIAYVAGQPKRTDVLTGAAAVIDVMKAAEVLREVDGRLTAVSADEVDEGPSSFVSTSSSSAESPKEPSVLLVRSDEGELSISIEIQIAVVPDQIEGLGATLRNLIDELRGRGVGPEN
jgi:hypothetical protein